MKIVLFPHLQGSSAVRTAQRLCSVLHESQLSVWADPGSADMLHGLDFISYAPFQEAVQDADVAVAIGGDGTMLHCARHIVGTGARLLGINTGRLGFLASMEPDQIEEAARLRTEDYRVSSRMLMQGRLLNEKGSCVREFTALNDVAISRNFSRVVDFTVSRHHGTLGRYRADGLVFSTPTGSTAYALSAGGPVIEPEISCIEMTLICPHALSARPMLFSPAVPLQVCCQARGEQDVYLCIDGEKPLEFPVGYTLEICGSETKLEILDLSGNTFFDSLSRKLIQPLKDGDM